METESRAHDRHDPRSDGLERGGAWITPRIKGFRAAVLLSTYNGERFVGEQLDSLARQTHRDWTLFWRDDGSTDGTGDLVRRFAAGAAAGRCIEVGPSGRLGPTRSFLSVLRAAQDGGFDAFAFADQDDVWLPAKLARAAAELARLPAGKPALYCCRQMIVDAELAPLCVSGRLRRQPGFPASLTQNIATGCTIVLNREAARLVAGSTPPSTSYHDWWSYLVVSAAGGAVLADPEAMVLYRQHGGNLVGVPPSLPRRAVAALRRGPGVFMTVFRHQVLALAAQPDLLAEAARDPLEQVAAAMKGGMLDRLRVLRRTRGLLRQSWPETLVFGLWFILGPPRRPE